MEPKAISLFCGAGGCSLGFKQAGYSIIFATDNNSQAIETYKINFPQTSCLQANIMDINFFKILKQYDLEQGELDFLIGGPPCQGFSTAGTRFWDDPRNHLLKSYVHALEVIQPKWFLMENVEGLLTAKKGIYLLEAVKAFIGLGYNIRVEKIYAQEYGIPQRRKRVLIVGNRLGINFQMPKPTNPVTGKIFRKSEITLEHAISGLPQPSDNKNQTLKYSKPAVEKFESRLRHESKTIYDHYQLPISDIQFKRISSLKPGQTMKDLPEELQHSSFKRRANRRVADGMPTEKRGGSPSGLKRLKLNEPSLTITGAAIRELIHPVENRPLTIRECARIQTFPDSFLFAGNSMQKTIQIANAIPPMLAKIFAEHIRENYGFESEKISKGKILGFVLTKASAMSPALNKTNLLLSKLLIDTNARQRNLLGG